MSSPMEVTANMVRIRSGNQMVAEGALRAGCKFFAGYPITPASGIYKTMIDTLPGRGGVAISAPDEISALAYCVGASLRGQKAMTATSGPGWALMIETVQYAFMTETPVVIAVVQRLGPSTGGATQNAQGDVLFVEYCISGGYTLPVFAPSNPIECYELTHLAFTWSELLRTPVVVLLDKEVGMTSESVDYVKIHDVTTLSRQRIINPGNDLSNTTETYYFERPEDIPKFIPVGGDIKTTVTGSAHNKAGRLQKNSPETLEVLHHLQAKIDAHANQMELVKRDIEEGARTLIISYGITARTSLEAVRRLRRAGEKVSWLNVLSLFPVPEYKITASLNGIERVVVAEENLGGLYRSVIRPLFGDTMDVIGVNNIGSMITPLDIMNKVI
jgi:2-oxoglutarate/2-oxoacid ferredoxin oxidoreductase subunit alpha